REAYFLKYTTDIRQIAKMPLMVTGGFRSGEGMEAAVASGATDVIGIARPLCTEPDVTARLLAGAVEELPHHEYRLRVGPGVFGPGSKVTTFKFVNSFGLLGWHCMQLVRLADGRKPKLRMSLLAGFLGFLTYDYRMAWHRHRAKRRA
ncbi:MAG: NADH:flavin oxidoreductase, partial [Sinobacteraceae bacterium]|nr:NADH:flavin oxidoreductase [Nevskiaceae bacterium]